MAKQKYYTVWKGRKTGVFSTWDECKAQTEGFEGAQYKAFPTKELAQAALAKNFWAVVNKTAEKQQFLFENAEIKPETDSISVDAACSGNPGIMEYRGVETATGKEIFHGGPYECGTNNIGEFLAIVHALAMVEKGELHTKLIYSDSETGQSWVKHRCCNSKLVKNEQNAPLFEVVKRAELWLRTHQFSTKIAKWHTEIWGEIPADFGRK